MIRVVASLCLRHLPPQRELRVNHIPVALVIPANAGISLRPESPQFRTRFQVKPGMTEMGILRTGCPIVSDCVRVCSISFGSVRVRSGVCWAVRAGCGGHGGFCWLWARVGWGPSYPYWSSVAGLSLEECCGDDSWGGAGGPPLSPVQARGGLLRDASPKGALCIHQRPSYPRLSRVFRRDCTVVAHTARLPRRSAAMTEHIDVRKALLGRESRGHSVRCMDSRLRGNDGNGDFAEACLRGNDVFWDYARIFSRGRSIMVDGRSLRCRRFRARRRGLVGGRASGGWR